MKKKCICDQLSIMAKFIFMLGNIDKINRYDSLNTHEMKTLLMLRRFPGSSMSFCSDYLMLENGSFTYIAKKLQETEYVLIDQNPNDKRSRIIELTQKGRTAAKLIEEQVIEQINNTLSILTETEQKKLFDSFDYIEYVYDKIANN